MSNEVKYMTLSEVVDTYLKKSRKVKKKPKAIRILRIYYYGKMKLAKAIRRRLWREAKAREFMYWRKLIKEMTKPYPKYEYLDTKTWEVKESDTPISATIKLTKPEQ